VRCERQTLGKTARRRVAGKVHNQSFRRAHAFPERGRSLGFYFEAGTRLGSGPVDQSQKMTVAARAMADKKTVGHLS